MNQTELYINQTYLLAKLAIQAGNHPFGALLVVDDEVLLTQQNTVISSGDATQHAELELIRKAMQKLSKDQLSQAILYTSTEPCAMCSAAIFWSGIAAVVYGCSAKKLGEITGGNLVIPCNDIFSKGNRDVNVTGPVLEPEGVAIHLDFWSK